MAMTDPGEVIDDPESGPPLAGQDRGREASRTNKPMTLDAEAILRKLDQRSTGLARSLESDSLPPSFPTLRPGGGATMVGSLPVGLGEGGPELGDRNSWPEPDQ